MPWAPWLLDHLAPLHGVEGTPQIPAGDASIGAPALAASFELSPVRQFRVPKVSAKPLRTP